MPTIGEFNPESGNFKSYETRIKQYFVANDIAAAKQVPAFISTIGVKGYKTLQDILAHVDPCSWTRFVTHCAIIIRQSRYNWLNALGCISARKVINSQ